MRLLSCVATLGVLIGCYVAADDSEVATAYVNNDLTPDIVATAPTALLTVTYETVSIKLGTSVSPLQTLSEPTLMSYDASDSTYHTLAVFGPDLPLDVDPPLTQFLHGLYMNIPGNNVTASDKVAPYFPPTPYLGNQFYVFVVYEQNGRLNTSAVPNMSILLNRLHFDINDFATKYNLTGPIAGNFMTETYRTVSN